MLYALKVAASIAALVLLVPLFVWGATGSLRHAWHATREYLVAMAVLCVPAVVLAILASLSGR